jgi:sugar phosphate isomerase/epimerase
MFAACQIESQWDYLFKPSTPGFVGVINAIWTLTNLYANNLEQRLDDIRSTGYNWVWVSYELGYAFEDEARQRAQVRRLIELAHQRGIRVTAYFSLLIRP